MTLRALTLCAACLVVGLAVGRFTAVPAEETHHEAASEEIAIEATETTEATEIAQHEAEEAATERAESTTERVRVVWRERIVQADGATEEREMELDAEVARLVEEAATARREVARLELELRSRETTEALLARSRELSRHVRPVQPDWRISGMVGLDLPEARAVYGASVERRLWGPLYIGATALSDGTILGQVSVGLW